MVPRRMTLSFIPPLYWISQPCGVQSILHGRGFSHGRGSFRSNPSSSKSSLSDGAVPSVSERLVELVRVGTDILSETQPLIKASKTIAFGRRRQWWSLEEWTDPRDDQVAVHLPEQPGRPSDLNVVTQEERMPTAKDSPFPTNVFYLHSLAHVELNAIDLAWDTMLRFLHTRRLPLAFFGDFLSIAVDESFHFTWLSERLEQESHRYGDLPVHRIIWSSAERTKHSLLARLAIGNLVQEARGLDAGPRLADRLLGYGDRRSSKIVARIADEEVAHVRAGVQWFLHICEADGIPDPVEHFRQLALEYANVGALKPPFNEPGRRQAGLEPDWYLPVSQIISTKLKEKTHVRSDR